MVLKVSNIKKLNFLNIKNYNYKNKMSEFNIENYLNSLPEDIETIDVSNKNLTYLPSLKRFYKLKKLNCSNNQ